MGKYRVVYTKKAIKDVKKIKGRNLEEKALELIKITKENPFQNPPPYEKLIGDLKGMYSRRINIQHRIVYAVVKEDKVIKILSMYSHYEL